MSCRLCTSIECLCENAFVDMYLWNPVLRDLVYIYIYIKSQPHTFCIIIVKFLIEGLDCCSFKHERA